MQIKDDKNQKLKTACEIHEEILQIMRVIFSSRNRPAKFWTSNGHYPLYSRVSVSYSVSRSYHGFTEERQNDMAHLYHVFGFLHVANGTLKLKNCTNVLRGNDQLSQSRYATQTVGTIRGDNRCQNGMKGTQDSDETMILIKLWIITLQLGPTFASEAATLNKEIQKDRPVLFI